MSMDYDLVLCVDVMEHIQEDKVEEVLDCADRSDFKPLIKFLNILEKPYIKQKDTPDFQSLSGSNENYKTFCGT